jgi:glycosyltransferase involved in cell wall biosynthesis
MKVSVVVPVYNAASYVSQAVESALQQPETGEVILVEDGSPDNGWEVCQRLASRQEKVRLFRHPNGENRGAGASRNLGMRNSSCEFISFLDADDYYLPGRFSKAREIFAVDADCDGVYEAVGMHVEDDVGLERWRQANKPPEELHTMTQRVEPEALWGALISGVHGHFHLDGFVLRAGALRKIGYMAEPLRLHQDTEFIIRAAMTARLVPGRLDEPVARWRVHGHNRISAPRTAGQKYHDQMLLWMTLYHWCKERSRTDDKQRILDKVLSLTMRSIHYDVHLTRLMPLTTVKRAMRLTRLLGYPKVVAYLAASGKLYPWSLWRTLRS